MCDLISRGFVNPYVSMGAQYFWCLSISKYGLGKPNFNHALLESVGNSLKRLSSPARLAAADCSEWFIYSWCSVSSDAFSVPYSCCIYAALYLDLSPRISQLFYSLNIWAWKVTNLPYVSPLWVPLGWVGTFWKITLCWWAAFEKGFLPSTSLCCLLPLQQLQVIQHLPSRALECTCWILMC